jgi:hypothetical protein
MAYGEPTALGRKCLLQQWHTIVIVHAMFGRLYQRRDDALSGPDGGATTSPAAYACALLAELLDRARVLDAVRRGSHEVADDLTVAVDLFLIDAEEARARGLRARLFCRTADGRLDPWSIDPADDLRDLGGELVPIPGAPGAL